MFIAAFSFKKSSDNRKWVNKRIPFILFYCLTRYNFLKDLPNLWLHLLSILTSCCFVCGFGLPFLPLSDAKCTIWKISFSARLKTGIIALSSAMKIMKHVYKQFDSRVHFVQQWRRADGIEPFAFLCIKREREKDEL